MGTIFKDIHYGIRSLGKHPGFTAVALITLALGIGANTAIFSVVNAVLLRPLPFDDPERIVWVWDTQPQLSLAPTSLPDFLDWKEQNRSFEHLAAYQSGNMFLDAGDGTTDTRYGTSDYVRHASACRSEAMRIFLMRVRQAKACRT